MSRNYQSAIRYNGGKSKQIDFILDYFPPIGSYSKYIEPFGGGASILINKAPVKHEVYNDLDGDIVNFFRVLRDKGEELNRLLELTPYSRDEYDEAFIFDDNDNDVERARKTVVRAMFGYGGRGGGFNAVGRNGVSNPQSFYRYIGGLNSIVERFKNVTIENRDALELMRLHDSKDTLFYLDPPFLGLGDMYEHDMSEEYHIELAEFAISCDAMVVISGYRSELYDELYKGWICVEKTLNVSSFRKSVKRVEMLWVKPNIETCNGFGLFCFDGGMA